MKATHFEENWKIEKNGINPLRTAAAFLPLASFFKFLKYINEAIIQHFDFVQAAR